MAAFSPGAAADANAAVAMQSSDESGSSSESEGAATQIAGCPAAPVMRRQGDSRDSTEMASSHLQRFDARPAGESEHCKSEAPAVKDLEWLVLTEGRDLVWRSERELVSRYGALP
jgi:hypothetical protein